MKALELRIGNYVNAHGGNDSTFCKDDQPRHIAVITHLSESIIGWNIVNGGAPSYYHNTVEPIPLTDEWLKKLGFDPYEAFGVKIGFKHPNTHHLFRWITENYSGEELPAPFSLLDGVTTQIKYVHQLQNLYFALTGEELGINQTPDKSENRS